MDFSLYKKLIGWTNQPQLKNWLVDKSDFCNKMLF